MTRRARQRRGPRLYILEHMFLKTFRSAPFFCLGASFSEEIATQQCNAAYIVIFLLLNDVSLLVGRRMKGNSKNVVKRDRREVAEKKK